MVDSVGAALVVPTIVVTVDGSLTLVTILRGASLVVVVSAGSLTDPRVVTSGVISDFSGATLVTSGESQG